MEMRSPMMAEDRSADGRLEALESRLLRDALPGLVHGFTTAIGSSSGIFCEDALRSHLTQRAAWVGRIHLLHQHHSADIVSVTSSTMEPLGDAKGGPRSAPAGLLAGEGLPPKADGAVVEGGGGGWLVVRTADCVPILAVHPGRAAAAVLHAGWRGVAKGIFPNLLGEWRRAGGIESVRLAFGPSIRSCCYEVKSDCLAAFYPSDLEGAVRLDGERAYLELTRVLLNQARSFGIAEEQVEILPQCTCCHIGADGQALFASYRRSLRTGEPTVGRNATYIALAGRES